jgi:hypothetical protein
LTPPSIFEAKEIGVVEGASVEENKKRKSGMDVKGT